MILVVGAAGKTGRSVVEALVARGRSVRALVRRPEQVEDLRRLGARDVVVADLLFREQVEPALEGIEKVYHLGPNMHPGEVEIAENILWAAEAAGCTHLVYHSVLHPQTERMSHHWSKLRVEERLLESRLDTTVLQPTAYMQNLLAQRHRLLDEGVYSVPYAAMTRISLVDLADVAQVAAKVLCEPGHGGATYALSSHDAPTQEEVAEILGQHLGRPIRLEIIPRTTWAEGARRAGLGDYAVETLLKMFAYYERYHFIGNAGILEWLLGRQPTGLADFLGRVVDS